MPSTIQAKITNIASKADRAKSGDLIQLPNAGPEFDEVKASGLGQSLGGKCQPGAWVTKP